MLPYEIFAPNSACLAQHETSFLYKYVIIIFPAQFSFYQPKIGTVILPHKTTSPNAFSSPRRTDLFCPW